jgi:hypothetical protein
VKGAIGCFFIAHIWLFSFFSNNFSMCTIDVPADSWPGNMLLNWTDEPDIGFVGFSPALVVGGTQGRLIRLRVSGASKFG